MAGGVFWVVAKEVSYVFGVVARAFWEVSRWLLGGLLCVWDGC